MFYVTWYLAQVILKMVCAGQVIINHLHFNDFIFIFSCTSSCNPNFSVRCTREKRKLSMWFTSEEKESHRHHKVALLDCMTAGCKQSWNRREEHINKQIGGKSSVCGVDFKSRWLSNEEERQTPGKTKAIRTGRSNTTLMALHSNNRIRGN